MSEKASLMLRLPADVKGWIAQQAEQNERSQNSQIVWLLRQAMATKTAFAFDDGRTRNQINPAYAERKT